MSDLKGKSATLSVKFSLSANLSVRTMFSHIHIRCASLCALKSKEIEKLHNANSDPKMRSSQYQEDQAYASGAIVLSNAYLEAMINEFYLNCQFRSPEIKELSETNIKSLNNLWDKDKFIGLPKYRNDSKLLSKYLIAYRIVNQNDYPSNMKSKLDDISNLIKLRDALVHYQSKGQSIDHFDPKLNPYKLDLDYLQKNIGENAFVKNTSSPLFPTRCIGADCAKWAVNSSIEFTDFFFSEIKQKKVIDDHDFFIT